MLRGHADRVAGLVYAVHSRPVNGYVWNTNPARGLYTRERLRADAAVSGAPARGVYSPRILAYV